eukprot:2238209-Pyramimonas_sp.AAC.1
MRGTNVRGGASASIGAPEGCGRRWRQLIRWRRWPARRPARRGRRGRGGTSAQRRSAARAAECAPPRRIASAPAPPPATCTALLSGRQATGPPGQVQRGQRARGGRSGFRACPCLQGSVLSACSCTCSWHSGPSLANNHSLPFVQRGV